VGETRLIFAREESGGRYRIVEPSGRFFYNDDDNTVWNNYFFKTLPDVKAEIETLRKKALQQELLELREYNRPLWPNEELIPNDGFVTIDVSLSGDELTVVYTNHTEREVSFGRSVTIKQFNDDGSKTTRVPRIGVTFEMLGLPANGSYTRTINLKEWFWGYWGEGLAPGRYEYVKDFSYCYHGGSPTWQSEKALGFSASAEFVIE
jgi:hypothetical protein